MFARFHYSIRPKTIVVTILLNLGGHAVALPDTLEDLVLKPTGEIVRFNKHEKQKAMLTEIKGDEESHSFKAAEKSTHKATMLESDTKSSSFNGSCFAPAPPLAPALLSPLFDTRNNCCVNLEIPCLSWIASFSHFTVLFFSSSCTFTSVPPIL
jgi:hypothetical protein